MSILHRIMRGDGRALAFVACALLAGLALACVAISALSPPVLFGLTAGLLIGRATIYLLTGY